MNEKRLPWATLSGCHVYMVGIKGSGMAALAELLTEKGARVLGSDVKETFYTDQVLTARRIPYHEGFSSENLPEQVDLLIHSSAYDLEHIEIARARKRGIPCYEYTQILGYLSTLSDAVGIAGVHGKTTTTALVGVLIRALNLPYSVLVGSAIPCLGGRCVVTAGQDSFFVETCEYQRHFLQFSPDRIVLTSIEKDHMDYFRGWVDIVDAFSSYLRRLPRGGQVIYCADDPGCVEVVQSILDERRDLIAVPYGERAEGPYRIEEIVMGEGETQLRVTKYRTYPFTLKVPGRHLALNSVAALAAIETTMAAQGCQHPRVQGERLQEGLSAFTGCKRRAEIVASSNDLLILDDYAHHPTAIAKTLSGLKQFYRGRRLIVDFMPHTYSRTEALFQEFLDAFSEADVVVFHKIYPSARETAKGNIRGRDLYQAVARRHPGRVVYFDEAKEALSFCHEILREGDLFVTMGAGNNWELGKILAKSLIEGEGRR